MKIFYHNLKELDEVAEKIIKFADNFTIWTFEGEMGVGKTTLIKAIGKHMGVLDTIQSPTFSIVNEYQTLEEDTIYHFDFYRLNNESEALDLGYEEYFYDQYYCFIEWPTKIASLIPKKHLKIIMKLESDSRTIELIKHE